MATHLKGLLLLVKQTEHRESKTTQRTVALWRIRERGNHPLSKWRNGSAVIFFNTTWQRIIPKKQDPFNISAYISPYRNGQCVYIEGAGARITSQISKTCTCQPHYFLNSFAICYCILLHTIYDKAAHFHQFFCVCINVSYYYSHYKWIWYL